MRRVCIHCTHRGRDQGTLPRRARLGQSTRARPSSEAPKRACGDAMDNRSEVPAIFPQARRKPLVRGRPRPARARPR
jgi:hypothetical protein